MESAAPVTTELAHRRLSSRQQIVLAAIFIVAAVIYSFHLGVDALGASEAYSAWAASKPDVASIVRIPILHDPGKQIFYYVVLHYFTAIFGVSEISLRAMSVVFALATIALVFVLGREMFDDDTALAATAIWAFNPLAVVFAHRARMYPMLIALALAQLLLLWRTRSRPNLARAILSGIVGAALIYTHMAAELIIAAEVGLLIRDFLHGRRNPMPWIAIAVTLLLFAPYLPIAHAQSRALLADKALEWIGPSGESPLSIKMISVAVGAAIAGWLILGPVAESTPDEPLRWLCAWAILPPLALAVGSIVVRPMFNLRYVAPATAAVSLIVARAIALVSVKWRNLAATGIAVIGLIVLPFDQPEPQPWREFARQISADGGAAEPVFFESGFVARGAGPGLPNGGFPFGYYSVPFDYYFHGPNPRVTIPGFDSSAARLTIESHVSAAGGGWLCSWKSKPAAKLELPDADHFKVVERFRQPDLVFYRITPVTPAATAR
jgi:4-amino-4-deoxy-L-arabinose transferase-like glycosyltransferase